jgi:hypothetical protein
LFCDLSPNFFFFVVDSEELLEMMKGIASEADKKRLEEEEKRNFMNVCLLMFCIGTIEKLAFEKKKATCLAKQFF